MSLKVIKFQDQKYYLVRIKKIFGIFYVEQTRKRSTWWRQAWCWKQRFRSKAKLHAVRL